MNNDYLWDRTGEPDAEVQQLEDVLGTLRYQPRPFELQAEAGTATRRRFFPALAIAATIALILLAAGIWLRLNRQQTSSPREIVKSTKGEDSVTASVVPTSPPPATVKIKTGEKERNELPFQRTSAPRRSRLARHSNKNASPLLPEEMTAAQRVEAEAAKDQLLLALRVVSAKLNLAQRKIPATNNIRNQHKLG